MLARDDEFAIVVARAGDNAESLAQHYLGDARKGWWITEGNGGAEIRPGQVVVIPLVPRNRVGVHADGFQTVPVLCYHRFGSRASKLTVTPAAFAAQMDYLARNGYHVLNLAQLAAFVAGREPLPKKSVVITIDDGYRATYDIAFPILKKYGFPATVFLYSDFVGAGDALTYPQMKELIALRAHRDPAALEDAFESHVADRRRERREISRAASPRGRCAGRHHPRAPRAAEPSRMRIRMATSTRPSSTCCRARASRSA